MRRRSAAPALLALVVLTACGGPVEIDVPDLDAESAAACEALVADLPDTLADEEGVETEPADAPGAAYGDPPIVVTCGVPAPAGFDETAQCEVANGVGWYIPAEQYGDQDLDLEITAAGYRPRLEVVVPDDYRPDAAPAVMAVLAPLVEEHTRLVDNCT